MSLGEDLKVRSAPLDVGVWLVVAVLLGGGYAYARAMAPKARVVRAFDGAVSFRLPAGWSGHEQGAAVRDDESTESDESWLDAVDGPEAHTFVAQLPTLDSIVPTVLVERASDPAEPLGPLFHDLEVTRMQTARSDSGTAYRTLHVDERPAFGCEKTTWVWFAIVRDPPHAAPGAAVLPIVVTGVDVLAETASGEAWHIAAFEPAHASEDDEGELRRIVEGLRITP